jgi:hypothetical protein
MSDNRYREDETVHFLKNQLSIIVSFAALLEEQIPADDPKRGDLDEIQTAANAALDGLRRLNAHVAAG